MMTSATPSESTSANATAANARMKAATTAVTGPKAGDVPKAASAAADPKVVDAPKAVATAVAGEARASTVRRS